MTLLNRVRANARRILNPRQSAMEAEARSTREALAAVFATGETSALRGAFQSASNAVREPILAYCKTCSDIAEPDNHLIIVPSTMRGRAEHFHHFFNGFLLPLILRMETAPFSKTKTIHVPDVGPMNGILDDVLEHYDLEHVVRYPALLIPYQRAPQRIERAHLLGMDRVHKNRNWFQPHEIERFKQFADDFAPASAQTPLDVLLLVRKPAEDYYRSESYVERYKHVSSYKLAGADRRSVANPKEIASAISQNLEVQSAVLEDLSFREQIALFRRARVVVGQHCAGLNGLVWSKPEARVLEIIPLDRTENAVTFFRVLAEHMGQKHTYLVQEGDHDAVDPQAVADLVTFLLHA